MIRKTIGRILLIGVGIAMIVLSVLTIIDQVKLWNSPTLTDGDRVVVVLTIVGHSINALAGLTALFGGIRGKKSIRLALTAIIMMIIPVVTLVLGIQANAFTTFESVASYILAFLFPILYFIGFLIL